MSQAPRTGTRQNRAADARQRLLLAAVAQFSNRPYDLVAIDDITRAAGTAHGSLFHHFESKRGLYLAAMEAIAQRLRVRHSQHKDATTAELVRRELEDHFAGIAEHPELFVSLMRGGIGADPEARQIFERDRWLAIETLASRLGLDGTNAAVRVALRGWIGSVDEAAIAWLDHGRPFPLARMVDAFLVALHAMLDAIRALDPSQAVARSPAAKRTSTKTPARAKRAKKR